jgi:uncharacterized protein DUF1236
MHRLTISTAAILLLMVGGAVAQQKEDKAGPQMPGSPGAQSPRRNESGAQGAEKAEPKAQPSKGAQKTEPKNQRAAQGNHEPKNKATDGKAETTEPRTKGTAQKAEPKVKGTAQKGTEPSDRPGKGTAEEAPEPGQKGTKGTAQRNSGERVQVSEQQKTNISQTLLKEKGVNRVTKVNFSINVGTRVPRSVRLVALPASIITIVPAYRAYRYFVVDERICIVDPATYEIVDVIGISNRTARTSHESTAQLMLTEEERQIILSEIEMSDRSTLGLGALAEGSEMPNRVELHSFPQRVVQEVPKVRDYKYVAAENRVAIVAPQSRKVDLVLERHR